MVGWGLCHGAVRMRRHDRRLFFSVLTAPRPVVCSLIVRTAGVLSGSVPLNLGMSLERSAQWLPGAVRSDCLPDRQWFFPTGHHSYWFDRCLCLDSSVNWLAKATSCGGSPTGFSPIISDFSCSAAASMVIMDGSVIQCVYKVMVLRSPAWKKL